MDHSIEHCQVHVFAALGRVKEQMLTGDKARVNVDVVSANAHLLSVLIRPVLFPPVTSAASVVPVPMAPYVTALPPVELVLCEMTKALLSGISTCVLAPIVAAVPFVMSVALPEVEPSSTRLPTVPPFEPKVRDDVPVIVVKAPVAPSCATLAVAMPESIRSPALLNSLRSPLVSGA